MLFSVGRRFYRFTLYFYYITHFYKSLFLRKKIKLIRCGIWFGRSGEGRSNPRRYGTKKWLPLFELLFSQYEFGDPNCRHDNLSQQVGFINRFTNWVPQEIKVKMNDSRLLKFYQENSPERKFNREFYGKKKIKEDSKFNEPWNFSIFQKKTKPKKILNSKNLKYLRGLESLLRLSLSLYIYIYIYIHISHLTDKMKRSFFQAAVVSILLYGWTTWMLTKRLEKKLDGNYTRMLRAILKKSWQQHHTRHQQYGHLPPITKAIQVRRTRHAGHCWRSRDEIISDVLLWTPTYGRAKAGRPVRTYIQQLCEDTGCEPEDLPGAMNNREKWWERVRDIRACGTTWWWWEWWYIYIYIYIYISKVTLKDIMFSFYWLFLVSEQNVITIKFLCPSVCSFRSGFDIKIMLPKQPLLPAWNNFLSFPWYNWRMGLVKLHIFFLNLLLQKENRLLEK